MQLIDKVAQFYEKHPFPALPWHAPLTSAVQTHDLPLLNYQAGYANCYGSLDGAASQPRILVAGSGTFEPVAVAMANPGAQITAVDLSQSSLKKLEKLARWKGLSIETQCKSILDLQGEYDYIIATGVLHHMPNPEQGLMALVSNASERAVFRIMVYSFYGRALLYGAKELASTLGIQQPKEFREMIERLPADHPYKIYFHLYTDAETDNGLADGFLHPCDNPFTVPALQKMLTNCGLHVGKFLMRKDGNPDLCDSNEFSHLDTWKKLEVLDLTGDLQENFIFFAGKQPKSKSVKDQIVNPALPKHKKVYSRLLDKVLSMDSATPVELQQALFTIPGKGNR